jgi:4-hydroxybenzoate polyprenyltransferase
MDPLNNQTILANKTPQRPQLVEFIICLRPKQWTKNLLVFAAAIFSIHFLAINQILLACIGFVLFCFVSSCVYILNDYIDIEKDKLHPTKRYRPMASGRLAPKKGLSGGFCLLAFTLSLALYINKIFFIILLVYFFLNLTYSFFLKNIVILDIMASAGGFVLRAVGGGIIINVHLTPWFLLCTLLLALFLAISKRRHEITLLAEKKASHRAVLNAYNVQLLDLFTAIVTTAALMCYALYTFTSGKPLLLMGTIPLVLYGIFRYLYLVYVENKGGSPETIMLQDRHIQITILIFIVAVILILYYWG